MPGRINLNIIGVLLFSLVSLHSAQASTSGYIAQGYWSWSQNPDADYARYLRITADSGYYCSLDGKSGFAFAIVKDSITTPMNGMNAIQWMPNSGDIVITGSEKGVAYMDRFRPFDSTGYWRECRDQDKAPHTTALRGIPGPRTAEKSTGPRKAFPWQRKGYSLSGRKSGMPSGRKSPLP